MRNKQLLTRVFHIFESSWYHRYRHQRLLSSILPRSKISPQSRRDSLYYDRYSHKDSHKDNGRYHDDYSDKYNDKYSDSSYYGRYNDHYSRNDDGRYHDDYSDHCNDHYSGKYSDKCYDKHNDDYYDGYNGQYNERLYKISDSCNDDCYDRDNDGCRDQYNERLYRISDNSSISSIDDDFTCKHCCDPVNVNINNYHDYHDYNNSNNLNNDESSCLDSEERYKYQYSYLSNLFNTWKSYTHEKLLEKQQYHRLLTAYSFRGMKLISKVFKTWKTHLKTSKWQKLHRKHQIFDSFKQVYLQSKKNRDFIVEKFELFVNRNVLKKFFNVYRKYIVLLKRNQQILRETMLTSKRIDVSMFLTRDDRYNVVKGDVRFNHDEKEAINPPEYSPERNNENRSRLHSNKSFNPSIDKFIDHNPSINPHKSSIDKVIAHNSSRSSINLHKSFEMTEIDLQRSKLKDFLNKYQISADNTTTSQYLVMKLDHYSFKLWLRCYQRRIRYKRGLEGLDRLWWRLRYKYAFIRWPGRLQFQLAEMMRNVKLR